MRLPRGQHPRLVHDDGGATVDLDAVLRRQLQQLVHAEGARIEVVAERHRRAPRHGGGDHRAPVLAAEIGDGSQRRGLARASRTLHDRHPSARASHRADRRGLFLAQRIASFHERCDLLLDRLGRQAVARLRRHAGRHLAQRLLHLQRAARGVEPGMGHVRAALGGCPLCRGSCAGCWRRPDSRGCGRMSPHRVSLRGRKP